MYTAGTAPPPADKSHVGFGCHVYLYMNEHIYMYIYIYMNIYVYMYLYMYPGLLQRAVC